MSAFPAQDNIPCPTIPSGHQKNAVLNSRKIKTRAIFEILPTSHFT
jgi:hypothetical protein